MARPEGARMPSEEPYHATTATVAVVQVQFPPSPPMQTLRQRGFVLPGQDYDANIAALKVAGLTEIRGW